MASRYGLSGLSNAKNNPTAAAAPPKINQIHQESVPPRFFRPALYRSRIVWVLSLRWIIWIEHDTIAVPSVTTFVSSSTEIAERAASAAHCQFLRTQHLHAPDRRSIAVRTNLGVHRVQRESLCGCGGKHRGTVHQRRRSPPSSIAQVTWLALDNINRAAPARTCRLPNLSVSRLSSNTPSYRMDAAGSPRALGPRTPPCRKPASLRGNPMRSRGRR